jgi:hypothetical protein
MVRDLAIVLRWTKRLESHLERAHGASGRGLHEKVSSVERTLDPGVVRDLRFVATIRNKLLHEASFTRIDDRRGFRQRAKRAASGIGLRTGLPWRRALAAGVGVAVLAGWLAIRG